MGGAGGEEVKEVKDIHFQTKDKFWGSNVQYDDCSITALYCILEHY